VRPAAFPPHDKACPRLGVGPATLHSPPFDFDRSKRLFFLVRRVMTVFLALALGLVLGWIVGVACAVFFTAYALRRTLSKHSHDDEDNYPFAMTA
jgi:hypothetical protein